MARTATAKRTNGAADPLPPLEAILPEDAEYANLIKQFPEASRVTIVRYNKTTDRWAHLGTVPADVFNEEMIQRRWGSGLFQARFRNSQGHIIHTVPAIEIEEDPDRPPLADPTPAPAGLGNPPAAPDNTLITVLLSQMKANQDMLLEVVRALGDRAPVAPTNDLTTMVAALATLHGIAPKPTTPLPEKIIEKILEKGMSGGTPENEWIGLLRDVIVEFKPAIRAAFIQKGLKPRPAIGAGAAPAAAEIEEETAEEEETEVIDATVQAVSWLKSQCATGAKPAALVPVVLHFVDAAQLDLLLAKPDDQIFSELNDPDLSEPSTKTWFESFFKELRAIRNISDPGRPGRDTPDANENVRVSQ